MSAIETQIDIYKDLEDWYVIEKLLFESLAKKVASLITDILDKNNVEYHSVTLLLLLPSKHPYTKKVNLKKQTPLVQRVTSVFIFERLISFPPIIMHRGRNFTFMLTHDISLFNFFSDVLCYFFSF